MSIGQISGGRFGREWRLSFLALSLTAAICASTPPVAAQAREDSAGERRIVARVEPEYPETLKRLYIGGVVKVEAVVSPTGIVESTQLIGGSPVLGQSAMKAIKRWRYAPASGKEKVVVQLEFDPHR
jgi:TonB family protein